MLAGNRGPAGSAEAHGTLAGGPAHAAEPEAADAELAAARAAWARLREVESVTVTVIVDNETDGLSTPCRCCDPALDPETRTPYVSEFTAGVQAGHGLSLLVEVTAAPSTAAQPPEGGGGSSGGEERRVEEEAASVVFDGGPSEELWAANVRRLGLGLERVGGAVLSHWHVDHSVGLAAVAAAASASRAAPCGDAPGSCAAALAPFVFDVHPDRPLRRGLLLSAGAKPVPFNEDVSLEALAPPGCRVESHAEPHTLLSDLFFVSGAIPRVTAFEAGQPGHATQGRDGLWRLDPHIMEERYLAVRLRGQGAVVFSGCSHAGIVNVVTHAQQVSCGPVFAVVGGLHLASRPMEARIPETVAALRQLAPRRILAGHCTGWRAKAALAAAFPDTFQPCLVGGTYRFLAPQLPPPPEQPPPPGQSQPPRDN
ncbi:hypothetical protein GPECTOR_22g860 [Gonium pectorale]|uniref:Metallo-beta-lactamase domain-containing protein n=1 Tax=Gonium pectorale TaxID=33097 RepID=A0A150GHI0_GONPE|nr:hypothetical protein GPECTOR_22g860 [Gonium pectorale]|eukprot:KXZ49267.1 hypothetical protein GPECTOR_22g860 [Gonium pectorale]